MPAFPLKKEAIHDYRQKPTNKEVQKEQKKIQREVFGKQMHAEIPEFISAKENNLQYDRNYERLITDTYQASIFL